MGSQNKSYGQGTKGTKCKSLCNDAQKRESPKSVARQTTQGWAHRGIEVKICNTLFLHPKERWFITIGSRLQKIKLSHNQGQDTTTFDWRSN